MSDKSEFINKNTLLQDFASAMHEFDSEKSEEFQRGVDWALRKIINHSTADVEEVRHGKWVKAERRGCVTYH